MSDSTRVRHLATYFYLGNLLPATVTRPLDEPTLDEAIKQAPEGDNWFAVQVSTVSETRYSSEDGDQIWVEDKEEKGPVHYVGKIAHWSDIPSRPENITIISNIRSNSPSGHGVRTRCGNWQVFMSGDGIIDPADPRLA